MTPTELRAFSAEVAGRFENGEIKGPIHLCGGNEEALIEIFALIHKEDWVFATYRNSYHALLHGLPRDYVMAEIVAGRSMNMFSVEHRFFTSAIVGGCLPIATGVSGALKRMGSDRVVWCFVGDMAASIGAFHDATQFAEGHGLQIHFIIEDNYFSTDSPTKVCWGTKIADSPMVTRIVYDRTHPHCGTGKWVSFV